MEVAVYMWTDINKDIFECILFLKKKNNNY
jgi:hypothetical protein